MLIRNRNKLHKKFALNYHPYKKQGNKEFETNLKK